MDYNVIDLINKAIKIGIRQKDVYIKASKEKSDIPSMKIVLKVIIKQIDHSIEYYEALKKEMEGKNFEAIDFVVYDKISFLINEFNERLREPPIDDVRHFLEFTLQLERDTYALFVDIQGRFVKCKNDTHTKTYIILSQIIENQVDFIKELEDLM
ncbi:hypothetical protein [Clostridium sp. HBUAS56017]|uniref:hypothetical protein n=1 Tax=Clostridium sp. HBUAS56017 TaxID=2571128 RepID=UPI0011774ABF|nr:hypothetical protein [Clostridium sp. HBUAS56017]